MSEEVRTEPALAGTAGTPEEAARIRLYDGLRGIAIVLVVLSHGWLVWPIDWIDDHAWVRPLFRNGNSGVTVFLVAGGFLMTRALTARRGLTAMRPDTALVRRIARVGPSLWLFLAVAVLVAAVDGSSDTWHADVGASVLHVVTYTWNWYVQGNLLHSVPDFGHLWYLSVDMQAFLFMAGVLYLLRRRPVGLLWTLGGLYLLFTWWRFHMEAGPEPLILVLLRTTVRIGPFVLGVLAASALPLLARVRWQPRVLSTISSLSVLALVPLLFACDRDAEYLTWGGTALEWTVAVFFTAIALGGTSRLLDGVVGTPDRGLARPQLPAALHLALRDLHVTVAPHAVTRMVVVGADRGRAGPHRRGVPARGPDPRAAGASLAALPRLAGPRRGSAGVPEGAAARPVGPAVPPPTPSPGSGSVTLPA